MELNVLVLKVFMHKPVLKCRVEFWRKFNLQYIKNFRNALLYSHINNFTTKVFLFL